MASYPSTHLVPKVAERGTEFSFGTECFPNNSSVWVIPLRYRLGAWGGGVLDRAQGADKVGGVPQEST